MKKLALIGLMMFSAGCQAEPGDDNAVNRLRAEIAQKEAALERAKKSGGYPEVTPPVVCAYGVLYFKATTYGGSRIYTPAINSKTLQPQRCNESSDEAVDE